MARTRGLAGAPANEGAERISSRINKRRSMHAPARRVAGTTRFRVSSFEFPGDFGEATRARGRGRPGHKRRGIILPAYKRFAQPKRWNCFQNSGQGRRGGPQTKISGWSWLSSLGTPREFPPCPARRQELNVLSTPRRDQPSTIRVEGGGVG